MGHDEWADLDAVAQAEWVRRGDVTPGELVEAAIARLEDLDPDLHSVVHRTFDRALAEAARAPIDAPLAGVPFLLKDDGGQQAGEPYTNGMSVLRRIGSKAREDSVLTVHARRAGLISLGRTNTPECALLPTTEPLAFGPSHNPWNPAFSPGGSSGGAAAAVAAGIVPIAHATDGGGSIRIPASCCGLVGLKPTRGRVSLGPDRGEYWSGLSTSLVVTRTVRDTAAALDALSHPVAGDPYVAPGLPGQFLESMMREPGRLRVGFIERTSSELRVHPDVVRAVRSLACTLEERGHVVEPTRYSAIERLEPSRAWVRIVAVSVARTLEQAGELLGQPLQDDDVEPLTWALAERGRRVTAMEHLADLEIAHRLGREIAAQQTAEGFDLLLMPTQALPPPRLGEITSTREKPLRAFARSGPYGAFTLTFNLTGQPAISLPAGFTSGEDGAHDDGYPPGLPIGAQLVAASGREDLLLQVARQLEEIRRWEHHRPPLFGRAV